MIYLDNCATTPLDPAVADEMARVSCECFGNPSSIHHAGRCALRALSEAREKIAATILARADEIVFTSSGTEANNFVISAVAQQPDAQGGTVHIVTSAVEHASVANRLTYEARNNPRTMEVAVTGVDQQGKLHFDELQAAIRPGTRLLTLLHCNNETGALLDLDRIFALKREHPRMLLHLDIVQSYLKHPFDMRSMPADYLTVSAHKICGPKGIGFVYIREGAPASPLLVGGAQERHRRAGTENVAAAAGFARAADLMPAARELRAHFIALERAFFGALDDEGARCWINGPPDHTRRQPGIFNLSFPGLRNKEDLVIACDLGGVMLSSTSACHSGIVTDSHVLRAMGLPDERRTGAVRLCFNKFQTEDEIREGATIIARLARRMAT
ncbi:MAG: cysteine desulfurase family protein [bacterium]|nr:cysteine desulfurase family protein [Candidatus Sumerlaeota bacterium]